MKKKCLYAATMLLLVLAFAFGASAAKVEIKDFNSKSTFKPVSYSTHKGVSSVTLYGNADYLCMKAVKDTKEKEVFRVEIFSDSKRKKMILEYENDYKKGTKYDDILFDLTELKSKTYYATSYVIKKKNDVYSSYEKDEATVTKFKIVVKRDGTEMKKMKTVMYGYENSVAGPIVYWYSVPGATKYYVYKKKDGKFKKIKTVKAAGGDMSYYIDTSLKDKNATAVYKVRAIKGKGKTPLSENEMKVYALKTPEVTVNPNPGGGVKLTWDNVSKNANYTIYVAKEDSDWEYVTDTKKQSYTYDLEMFELEEGKAYFFTVVAKTSKAVSGYENNKGLFFFLNPTVKSVKAVSGNIVLSWNAAKGADSYNIYRKPVSGGEWSQIGSTKGLTFTDKSIKKNTLYSYCVKSAVGTYECEYRAEEKKAAVIDVPVMNPIETDDEGNPIISWSRIEGVSYRIRRKAEGQRDWTSVGTSKSETFTDKNIGANGRKYYYMVNAYIDTEHGEGCNTPQSFTWYRAIRNAAPSPAEKGIRLSWEKGENIEGYNIYRKTPDSEYAFIATATENSFNDKTAIKDVSYTYKIVCVADGEEKSITAAELTAKVSSQYITVRSGTAETDDPLYCRVMIKDYDSSARYILYTKKDEAWVAVDNVMITNGKLSFRKNKGSYVNEYAIASVSADGTVTTVSDENIFTLKYIVPPEVTVEKDHQNYRAALSWKPVAGAEKYIVYLRDKKIAELDSTETAYKTGKLQPEEFYRYSVGAVRGKTEHISYDCIVYIIKKPDVKVKSERDGVNISWDGAYGENYTVYRKTTADGEWKVLKKVDCPYYTDKTAKNGGTYYYTVQTEGGAKNEKGKKVVIIKPVKISDVTLGKKSVELKWKKSSAADCYMVYKKKDGKWKKVYTTKDNKTVKYTDKDVKAGKKYYYRIYAVKNGVKSEYTGRAVSFIAPPAKLKATAVSGGVKLTFNKVEGAKKYVIYRKSGDGKFKKIKTLKSSTRTYTDKSIKKGVKYTYYVKAYNNLDYSKASSKVSFKK
ncbi:MAG: hypothetical protein IJN88_00670 [Clostridia bacterium]|nr:hypothetical protein [Clostridia bacterium]